MEIDIQTPINLALQALTPKQRDVMIFRYELSGEKKRSLQDIADDMGITRERVRQIQLDGLRHLRSDTCMEHLSQVIQDLEGVLVACGGIAGEEYLCRVCDFTSKSEKGYVRLLLEVAEPFSRQAPTPVLNDFWYLDDETRRSIEDSADKLHSIIREDTSKIYTAEEIRDMIKAVLPSICRENEETCKVLAELMQELDENGYGGWGYYKNPQISLNSLVGYIMLILTEVGQPLHFEDISKRIEKKLGKNCHTGSCHNELVRNKDFILVGRGIYGLKNQGYNSGTITDIIRQALKDSGPLTKEEVIDYVNERRIVKERSILQSLLNKNLFARTEGDKYTLAS